MKTFLYFNSPHHGILSWILCLFLYSSISFSTLNKVDAQPSGFVDQIYADNFVQAVGLTFDANGRTYVYEKGGKVWIVENGVRLANPLIDISEEVGNWRDFGMLGFVLDPNFLSNGYIYMLYVVDRHHLINFGTSSYNPNTNEYFDATIGRITRYQAEISTNFTTVDYSTRTILMGETLQSGPPILHESHGTGALAFGTDGTLIATLGDGASYSSVDQGSAGETYYAQALADGIITPAQNVGAYRCQQLSSLNGKAIRIDPMTGNGLPSNPYYQAGNPGSNQSMIWATGLRNPCRMSKRPETGSHNPADGNPGVFYIGDVGWASREELNVMDAPGQNFGWPKYEGMTYQPGYNNNAYTPSSHTLAKVDWRTGTPRASINGNIFNIGSSQVPGPSFQGNCSIGGVWYNENDFPADYQNSYYHADYGGDWIKQFKFDANDNPTSVSNFLTGAFGIVFIGTSPIDGDLYYIAGAVGNSNPNVNSVHRISFVGGNLPPIAILESDVTFGTNPLTVQFVGDQSYDPNDDPLTYAWNFGDGSPISNEINPQHTFTTSVNGPTSFDVILTVTDSDGLSAQKTMPISLNNTPPNIISTSIDNVNTFPFNAGAILNLSAVVNDNEHSNSTLAYTWITELHHNDHFHAEPAVNGSTANTALSPIGCDGSTYWYRIKLIVTDPGGLSTLYFKDIFPDCSGTSQTISFATISDKLTTDNSFTVTPTASSGLPVILHVLQGPATVSGNTISLTGLPGEVVIRAIQSGDGTYQPALPIEQTFDVRRLGGGSGLSGTYFNNIDLTAPILNRVDPVIDFDWGTGSPDASIGIETFSIRWEGEILPEYNETYTFRTTTDDGVRLWVNNQLIIDQWIDQAPTAYTGNIALTANAKVSIKMEYFENDGGASAKLEWSSPSQAFEVIPQGLLFPNTVDVTSPIVTLSTANTTVNGPFSVAINFSESVTGLTLSDLNVTNGSKSALTGSGQTYSFTITPTEEGLVAINLPANRANDDAGNGNIASNTLSVDYDLGGGGCTGSSNIALNKTATQSSDYSGGGAGPELAVDGNTNGNWWTDFSVSSTGWQNESYWQVDLGEVGEIENINLWNRTDCCEDFLSNYYVLVSDLPFQAAGLTATINQSGVSAYEQTANVGNPTTVTIDRSGRYVRIQKSASGFMALAEVEVIGCIDQGPDITPPSVTLTTPTNTVNGSFVVTTTFSESVSGLSLADFNVSNGSKSGLSGSGATYNFTVNPTNEGNVSILLPANSASDLASNGNTVSNTLNVNYEIAPACDNVTNAGTIAGDQANCDPYNPSNISNTAAANGGSGTLAYQWQRSTSSPAGPWTNVSGATSQAYNPTGITQTTWYRRGAKRGGCTSFLHSNVVIKEIENCNPTDYCTAQGTAPWVEWIDNVTFGAINNNSVKELYGDFTNLTTDIDQGGTYTISLTNNYSWDTYDEYWRVWIDWNQDGDFNDAGETVVSEISTAPPLGITSKTTTADITVPGSAATGSTRMRVSMQRGEYANSCGTLQRGEVEDYSVNIVNNGPVLSLSCPSNISVTAASGNTTAPASWSAATATSTCPTGNVSVAQTAGPSSGSNFPLGANTVSYEATDDCSNMETCNFTVTVLDGSTSLTINCPNNITITAPSGSTAAPASWSTPTTTSTCTTGSVNVSQIAGPASGGNFNIGTTTISYEAVDGCSNVESCSFTVTVIEGGSNTGYCASSGSQPWIRWIGNVSFGSIDNDSGKNLYGDFTAQTASVSRGDAYPISLQAIFSWGQEDENFRVWIDWNQDGDFEDANETVLSGISLAGTPPTPPDPVTGSITVPANAALGITRMRVSMKEGSYAEPCEAFTLGEVEDYSIQVNAASSSIITNPEAEILYFSTQKTGRTLRLNWVTNTEYKNNYFEIERSQDGNVFELLRRVNSTEDSTLPIYYQQVDNDPHPDVSYYRVKTIFNDGSFKYSSIEMVMFDIDTEVFSVFPNPAKEDIYVNLKKYQGKSADIQIYNAKGQAMLVQKIGRIPNDPFRIDLQEYTNGIYTITIKVEDRKRLSSKFVVSKLY